MSKLLAFFDESGDLGWKFDAPYRAQGSSRYFVIACALGAGDVHNRLAKVVKQLWALQKWTTTKEKKWADMSDQARLNFARLAVAHLEKHPEDRLSVSILKKQELPENLRADQHILYAHLATQLICEECEKHEAVTVCPDELNAGTGKTNLLQHLMCHELWFRRGCSADVKQLPSRKPFVQALEFCDMLAGVAASHFEDGRSEPWNTLSGVLTVRHGA